jgi:proteasome lid subunit RPN8/RPN11
VGEPSIEVSEDVVEQMKYHAREADPLEACALLLGSDSTIDEYYEMTNTDESEVHFTFDPEEQVEAQKHARDQGKDVVGVFHSHPDHDSEAYPSEEDQDMGHGGYIYFILNFQPDETIINAFEFVDDAVEERSFTVT